MPTDQPLTCQDCNKTSPEVKQTTCPFQSDVHAEIVPITVCPECYQERLDDI